MIRVGITGGIGAGKSASAEFLRRFRYPLLDTDDLARSLVAPESEGLKAIVDVFGRSFLQSDGALDRRRLAAFVFQDSSAKAQLEAILHPRIHAEWTTWLQDATQLASPVAFVVIPLLYEKDYDIHFDSVVAVGCTMSTQLKRLLGRGWTNDEVSRRLKAQLPMEEKLKRASHVVWNEGNLECLQEQWLRLIGCWERIEGSGISF